MLRDCSAVLGPLAILQILTQHLKDAAQAANGAQGDWRGVEAAYHCMGALKDERLPRGHPMVMEARAPSPRPGRLFATMHSSMERPPCNAIAA